MSESENEMHSNEKPHAECTVCGRQDERIKTLQTDSDTLFAKVNELWADGVDNLEKEIGDKVSMRLFLAILSILTIVLLTFAGMQWGTFTRTSEGITELKEALNAGLNDVKDDMYDGFLNLVKQNGTIETEVQGIAKDLDHMEYRLRQLEFQESEGT